MAKVGRPEKNNADWFSHDREMRNHRKIKALRTKFGITGYAVFCMMLERLSEVDFCRLPLDETEYELLSGDFGLPTDDLKSILEYATKLGLFTINDAGIFTSQGLVDRLQGLYDYRNKKRASRSDDGVLPVPNSQETNFDHSKLAEDGVWNVQNTHSRVEYSKEEYSGGEEPRPLSDFGFENVVSSVKAVMDTSSYKGKVRDPTQLARVLSLAVKSGVEKTPQDWSNYFQRLTLKEGVYA